MRNLSTILVSILISFLLVKTATAQWVAIQTPDSSQIYCVVGCSLGLFVGTDSGAYFSNDHGAVWSALSSGLIKPVKNIAVSGTNIYVATNASLYLSANSGGQWTEINQRVPGSYGYPGLVTDGNRVFAGGIGHHRGDMESDYGWIISSDSLGTNWRDTILENGISSLVLLDTLIIAGNNGYQGPLGTVNPPLDNVNGNSSANSDGYIYISTDFGNTWASLTGPTSPPKRLIANSTNIFAGTWDAGIFRSSNNGTDWIQSNDGLTDNFISCFAVSGNAVFAGNGSGVFLTTDNAAQWRPVNIGLTALSITGLTVADSTLCAITNNGSFKLWRRPLSEMIPTRTIFASAGAHGSISPAHAVTLFLGSDQRFIFTPDVGYIVDSVLVDGVKVDSTEGYTFYNIMTDHTIRVVFRGLTVTVEWTVGPNWSMISCPIEVANDSFVVLFPNGVSDAFCYVPGAGYQTGSNMKKGMGYWLQFNAQESVTMTGLPLSNETIAVEEGWNIIGSISTPIPVQSITSDSGTMLTSNFFGYNGNYFISDTIYPGKGYWVKVNQAGKLILSSTSSTLGLDRISIMPSNEQPPPPPEGEMRNLPTEIPTRFALEQNYPNPFNPSTTIIYQLPTQNHVTLKVFDVLGREVATLVNGIEQPGYKSVLWDARSVPSGVYFYRLQTGSNVETKQLLLLR